MEKIVKPKAEGKFYNCTFHSTEVHEHLVNIAKKYKDNEFKLYIAEMGWEDWMNDYTEAKEDKECSEKELENIEAIQAECFNEAHEDKVAKEYEN